MENFKKIMKEWVIPFGLEIIVLLLLIKYVFFFVNVPTGSMIPTIDERSWLFATRLYNQTENIKRGDILVFDSSEINKTLIKRVIGLPGEHVFIDGNGAVYINGTLLDEPYVKNPSPIQAEFSVPEGQYLFLGDNRSGSSDAREWNDPYIPAEEIFGHARFTILPLKNFGILK